jgi:sterol desaturase/sphingolipid hydroxylase (fatty acid hydroxylase superfamily)
MDIMSFIQTFLGKGIDLGINPSSRLYWPFFLSSLLIAFLLSKKGQFKSFFSKTGIFHASSLLDIKLLAINLSLKTFIFPLFLFSSFTVSVVLLKSMRLVFPHFNGIETSLFTQSLIATVFAFVSNDFLRFLHHVLMHEVPGLRNFHRTHHSARVLTPITLFRSHPLESMIAGGRNALSTGHFLAFYTFMFKGPVSAFDILGVNAFGFIFNAFASNLRHSPIPLSFGILEYVFISPRMHQIHHSANPIHFNKNYGVALSFWDQLWGTFYRPSKVEASALVYGLQLHPTEEQLREALEFKTSLLKPIKIMKPSGVIHENTISIAD